MKYQYLFETDDTHELATIQSLMRHFDGDTRLTPVMVESEPNYGRDGEYMYATEDILPVLYDIVKNAIWDECTEEPNFVPLENMPGADRWKLMSMAINEWGHLGNNGASPDQIAGAWRDGQLDFIFADRN